MRATSLSLPALAALAAACGRADLQWRADLAQAPDPYRRALAAAALGEPDEPQLAFRALLAAQADPAPEVRARALRGVARLAPAALPEWLASGAFLELSDAGRSGLAEAVERAGPAASAAVAEALQAERDPARALALAAFARREPARELALRRLLAIAAGEEEALAARALDALRELDAGPEVLPALLARLHATSGEARAAALALALRILGAELESLEPAQRRARVDALGGPDALAELCVEGLASERPGTPLRALLTTWSLLECRAPLAPPPEGAQGPGARTLAALRLARAGPAAEPALVAALADEAPEVRAAALLALACAPRGAEARAAIDARLFDATPVVRRAAHHARGALAGPGD